MKSEEFKFAFTAIIPSIAFLAIILNSSLFVFHSQMKLRIELSNPYFLSCTDRRARYIIQFLEFSNGCFISLGNL